MLSQLPLWKKPGFEWIDIRSIGPSVHRNSVLLICPEHSGNDRSAMDDFYLPQKEWNTDEADRKDGRGPWNDPRGITEHSPVLQGGFMNDQCLNLRPVSTSSYGGFRRLAKRHFYNRSNRSSIHRSISPSVHRFIGSSVHRNLVLLI